MEKKHDMSFLVNIIIIYINISPHKSITCIKLHILWIYISVMRLL